ncbi:hypothetical protein ACFSUS_11175 [Spirosoma soli]|uniref:Lipoprotein n=1 Tax=Spirosoma soli TaxID=1770529 RepID=A0ABW5M2F7_9BACT
MKKVFFSVALLGLMIACDNKENVTPQADAGVKVAYQKSVRLAGTSLDMKVAAVTDSRCPINARCVTAGSVKVNFEANQDGNVQAVELDLPAYPDKSVRKTFSLGGQSYQLTLQEVLPYPEAGKPIELEDYTVQFSVVKQ